MSTFKTYTQLDAMDCGPTCLRMIAKHYGRNYSLQSLREKCFITREGVSLLGISDAAEKIGLRSMGVRITFDKLRKEAPLPCIAHWHQDHFVVVYKISGKEGKEIIHVADPGNGLIKYKREEFLKGWISTVDQNEDKGIALLLEPAPDFYNNEGEKPNKTKFSFLLNYVKPHKKFFTQLLLGMLLGSLLQLIFPFLTQSIVDKGISNQDIGFIWLIMIAQFVLILSRTLVDFIRNWILLHISTRINISLISDFLIKLMKLPLGFFDSKKIGDIMQRISDHTRIEHFLTSSSLSILFSMFNLILFSVVIALYDLKIFAIFCIGSIVYFLWVYLFMKKRRELDFKRFAQLSDNQGALYQMITGMQEIKLNNCEKQKRWQWERIQAKLFNVNIKSLSLSQYQQIGAVFFNETKNIAITFLAAYSVIKGEMTLGMMMAVQYIIGQLNSPVEQMISFMQAAQDAKISMERLGEIHLKDDEEKPEDEKISIMPENRTIHINNLNFQYEGPHSEMVLKDINVEVPHGKVTAIVGTSGSGKTTLVKLMLGFYPPVKGDIMVGGINLKNFSVHTWREKCGAVMQDGYIFSESIANNITMGDERPDKHRLLHAVKVANIQEYIESQPLGYNTKIGLEGSGLSQGQRQRILIARAVYKDPEFIFFDEATNALDANNERIILDNLNEFFKGKTAVIVAHRLSTVKNADKIIVIEKGEIVETGTHEQLTALGGHYYQLVKNQLELGT
ncbi:MAG: peptidase domain-containing ABC transporter [Bacteroidota bacterium]